MKHAGSTTLAELAPLLSRLRELHLLSERKPGTFYLRSTAFLHFHEDPKGLFADLKTGPTGFERFPVSTADQQAALLTRASEAVARAGTRALDRASERLADRPPVVAIAELEATVLRMEQRFKSSKSERVKVLMRHYAIVCRRFESDLAASPRDLLLAKASALMLVQSLAKSKIEG